ncbi:MAG: tryptophan ABC transporter substrate-binding protein [Enterococcus sp.]
MRNKRLIGAYLLVLLLLAGSFIYEKVDAVQQQKNEVKTVGVLQYVSHPALDEIYRGIKAGLKENGYTVGKNVKILYQNGQADQSKLATMSQQLVEKNPDALIGIATPAAQSLANATTKIPLVLGAVTDPVSSGLVKSMKAPSGNITGVSDQPAIGAQLSLAKKLIPDAKTVGILYSSTEDNSLSQVKQAEKEAKALGLNTKRYAVPSSNELSQTVQVMGGKVDFIYIPLDNTIANAMQTVINVANKEGLPVIPSVDTMVEQGGLATIGINQYELGVESGKMTADILSGKSETASTPVYTFKDGDTIINTEQAKKLGITIPDNLKKEAKLVTDTTVKEEEK